MLRRLVRALWGDLSWEELKKFGLLALGFFFLIGSYWPLKILKDVIFINMVGSKYQPDAKILSLIFLLPLILIYSKLVDYFPKERLIYFFIALYCSIGLTFVYLFLHPTLGVANSTQSPYRLVGWAFYLFVESYIAVMIALYWSFINDVTTPESAQKGYGMLIFGSQFGAVVFISIGNFLSRDPHLYAQRVPLIALISIIMFLLIAVVVFLLKHVVSKDELEGYQGKTKEDEEKRVGFWEGIKTIVRIPYVGGIFGLVFLHEAVSGLMHYQMLRSIEHTYMYSQGLVNRFLFDFTLIMQSISCLFALFGTAYFQRKFGVKGCLVAYPVLLGLCITCYLFNPTLAFIAGVVIIAKGINYVLNQPAKEMLYIPTTKTVKYKSKAWIDMFGMRSAKMAGSVMNKWVGVATRLTSSVSMGLILIWIVLARTIGTRHDEVIKRGDRIGE